MILPTMVHRLGRWVVRRCPNRRGVWRLKQLLLDTQSLRFPRQSIEVQILDGLRMRVDPNDLIGRSIFHNGLWEPPVAIHFAKSLRPGDTVLDIGANLGQFTLLAARAVGDRGRVFAIEASPPMARRLRHNIELNRLSNVEVIEAAAWDREERLYLDGGEPGNHGAAKVVAAGQAGDCITVPAVRLDAVLATLGCQHIDAIKIDVEGAEERALRGLSGILGGHWPRKIYCEVASVEGAEAAVDSLVRLIESWGYQGAVVDDRGERALESVPLPVGFLETVVFSRD